MTMVSENNMWDSICEFEEMLRDEECDSVDALKSSGMTVVALYAFYHYFNADNTKIEEMLNGVVVKNHPNLHVVGVFSSSLDEESVDFLSMMEEDYFKGVFISDVEGRLKELATKMAYVVVKTPYMDNEDIISVYSGLNNTLSDDNVYTNRILCGFELPVEDKIRIQKQVSSFTVKEKNVRFEIVFQDDIQEEIDDIENPKEYVPYGELALFDKDSICFFGEEKSFITTISAESLKRVYFAFCNRGLFDSNLRFFVSSKKIDPKIVNSIENDSENFCYYNNGIIITCDDYIIDGTSLKMTNFSIVNGGQTTNLIGRTEFNEDFPVICKLIKNKYLDVEKRVEFLAKVAEASNTQKPINAKDLIANRKEQRLLKIQFERCGIFLKVKRGEKIDKTTYKENWQNASNDEIAQFIYSMIYQSPGAAKNSKSKLLDTDKIYNKIFATNYTDGFFISVQHLKIAYSEWLKKLKRVESKTSVKYGLAKNAFLMCMATYGLIYKSVINDELRKYLLDEEDLSNTNMQLKLYIQQNDIGQTNVMMGFAMNQNRWNIYYSIFELIFGNILMPAYSKYKKAYPTYAYSQFTKSDNYYYTFVVPQAVSVFNDETTVNDILVGTEMHKVYIDLEKVEKENEQEYRPGLEQELIDYRRKVYHESNKEIQAYEVITNRQLSSVMKYLPKSHSELAHLCYFKSEQLSKYGDRILEIINKYTSINNLV